MGGKTFPGSKDTEMIFAIYQTILTEPVSMFQGSTNGCTFFFSASLLNIFGILQVQPSSILQVLWNVTRDGSFEYPQHIFGLRNKKYNFYIITWCPILKWYNAMYQNL